MNDDDDDGRRRTICGIQVTISAVTVSIFGCAVGFGRYFDKNRGSGSVFIVPGFNHVQSTH